MIKAVIEIDRYDGATDGDRLKIRPIFGSVLTVGDETRQFFEKDGISARQRAINAARVKGCTDLKIIDRYQMRLVVANIRVRDALLKL